LLILFLSGLLFWASLTILLPTLPLYLQSIGATPQQLGVILGGFAIGLLVFRFVLGYGADRRRKAVLLVGLATVAIAPLGYWLTESLPLLFGVRMFHGLSVAAFTTAYLALVTDLAPRAVRGEILGYMTLVNPVGMAIGPALGGYVEANFGYDWLFWTSVTIGLLGLWCGSQVNLNHPPDPSLPNPPLPETGTQAPTPPPARFWKLLVLPAIYVPSLVLLLMGTAFGTFGTFLSLFVKESAIDLNAGLVFTAAAIGSFGIRVLAGKGSDRYGRGLFISLGLLSYSLSILCIYLAQKPWHLLGAGVLEGCGFGMLLAALAALMADRSPPQERARSMNFCFMGLDLGIAIAGPVLGKVAETWGYRSLFGIAAVLPLLGLGLFLVASSRTWRQSLRFALGRGQDGYAINEASYSNGQAH
ncbi:MAG: MFS transporter, partial [Prochlorothrix sp.]